MKRGLNTLALNVIELFGGIGAFTQAVKSLDLPINIVDYVEINPYSVKAYNAINGTDFPPQDITQFHAIGEKYSNIDVIMHGSPCFTEEALVLTKNGYKKIIDVKVGDYVLTHENTYEKVVNFFDNGAKDVMQLKLACADLIKLTPNHRCYVRTKVAVGYTDPVWKEAEQLTADDYIGYAIHEDSFNADKVWNLITSNGAYDPNIPIENRIKIYMQNTVKPSWTVTDYTDALEIGHAIAYLLNKPFKLRKLYTSWSVSVEDNCHDCFYMSGKCWYRVLLAESLDVAEHVYDIEVENAHSFTVSGNIFHNCQDFSIAGKQKGGTEGSGTRSSLLYETIRIVTECKPKVVIWENVPNLVSSKFQHVFMDYVRKMIALGYRSYYKVLNAKDYGIPQNRERVFTVSILGEHKPYVFPEKEPLHLRLIDLLEKNVDESYYLSDKMIEKFTWTKNGYNNAVASQLNAEKRRNNANAVVDDGQRKPSIRRIGPLNKGHQWDEVLDPNGIIGTIASTDYKQPKSIAVTADSIDSDNVPVFDANGRVEAEIKQVGQLYGTETEPNPQAGRVYDAEGISPTMDTCSGGNRMPKIVEMSDTATVNKVGNVYGDDGKEHPSTAVYSTDGVAPTVCALANKGVTKVVEAVADGSNDAVGCAVRMREDGEQLEFRKNHLVSALHSNIMKSMVATPATEDKPQLVGGVGENDWNGQFHQGDRVYDANGVAVTLASQGGGIAGGSTALYAIADSDTANVNQVGWVEGNEGKVHQSGAVYGTDGVAPSQCVGKGAITRIMEADDTVIGEAKCLRPVRTEQGKAMRKQYEAGEIDAKWSDMRELEPRPDDCTNTLTTVQKDNLIAVMTPQSVDPNAVIDVRKATKKGFSSAQVGSSIDIAYVDQNRRRGRVLKDIAHTLVTSGNEQAVVEPVDPFIVASRGRNPENPSDRTVGAPTTQHLEANSQGICNTLTTVQKDNYVCEPKNTMCFRIRKLLPIECWRLMSFSDECYYKAEKVVSKSRLYEQAGNSIVCQVLERIVEQLLKSVEFEGLKTDEQKQ
jgi:DNA-cytosine methyltransferase